MSQSSVRDDSGSKSYIYRSDLKKLWLVDWKRKTYVELDTPVRLEDNVSGDSTEVVALGSEAYQSVIEITPTMEEHRIGVYNTKLRKAHVVYPNFGTVTEVDVWLTQDLDFESALFEELHRHRRALDIRSRDWFHQILELDGIAVQWEIRETSTNATHKTTSKLTRVREETLDPDHYALPEGFTREEFRLDFAIGGKKKAPPDKLSYSQ